MSFKDTLSKFRGKAKGVVDKSGDKIAGGVDKVTDKIDEKTHGKYHDKLEKVDNLAAKLDKTGDKAEGMAADTAPDMAAGEAGETPAAGA